MDTPNVLRNMIIGLLPLLVFIVVDELWGTKVGLIVAITFGAAEFAITYLRSKKVDRFIALDMGLLVVMGGVSLILENDLFFKLKPALIELILAAIIGISLYSPRNLIMLMTQRYMQGIQLNEMQQRQMKRNLKMLFYLVCGHTLLIVYAAYWMSKEAWAFISGALLYIIIGIYFLAEFGRQKILAKKYRQEWLPIVDVKGAVIGKAPRDLCHTKKELLHPVVHLHVVNKKGEIYLQKRSAAKKIQPGKWDTSVGGHIPFGETVESGLAREAAEELGITGFDHRFITVYLWESELERELVYTFMTRYDGALNPDPAEIEEGRFWTHKQIRENLGRGLFTPNFENEYTMIKTHLKATP